LRSLVYAATAERDLWDLIDRIIEDRGAAVAERHVARTRKACDGLLVFPDQGAPRGDIAAGLRAITIDRRVLVLYVAAARDVIIVRIRYGGRDVGGAFATED
jgi:toxin ParE1/3/4